MHVSDIPPTSFKCAWNVSNLSYLFPFAFHCITDDMIPRFNEDNVNNMIKNIYCLKDYATESMRENRNQALNSLISKKTMKKGDTVEVVPLKDGETPIAIAVADATGVEANSQQPEAEVVTKNEDNAATATVDDKPPPTAAAAEEAAPAEGAGGDSSKQKEDGDAPEAAVADVSFKVPGTVYYIFQQRNSVRYYLKKGNYTMATLNRLWPLEDGMKHHAMSAYRSALRGLRLQNVGSLTCDFNRLRPIKDVFDKDWKMCEICTMGKLLTTQQVVT